MQMLLRGTSHHKGLRNKKGENNCFLNASIQALWHLDSFRELLQRTEDNFFPSDSLFIRLKSLFVNFEYGDTEVLPPDEVRSVLSSSYHEQLRFQMGDMEDAGEALEAMLRLLHCEEVGAESFSVGEDTICEPPCLSHLVFACQLMDSYTCGKCGATSNPELSSDFAYRIYVNEFLEKAQNQQSMSDTLALLTSTEPERHCSEHGCKGDAMLERWCLSPPLVMSFSFIWPSNTVSKKIIEEVLCKVEADIDIEKFMKLCDKDTEGQSCLMYSFQGMICYSSSHYFSFFYSPSTSNWLFFDDEKVRPVGDWNAVIQLCIAGRYQPTSLLYEKSEMASSRITHILQRRALVQNESKRQRKADGPGNPQTDEPSLPQVQAEPPRTGLTDQVFEIGDKVEAAWKDGEKWYSGKVTEVTEPGLYSIRYNHGHTETGKEAKFIRAVQDCNSSRQSRNVPATGPTNCSEEPSPILKKIWAANYP